MKKYKILGILFVIFTISNLNLSAQDKEAKITLKFDKEDSINVCKAFVTSGDSVVKEISVKLYVQRLFGLLPIGDGTTDDDGMVSVEFPSDIPGDKNGKLTIIAKIEDDENYANTESKGEINWGIMKIDNDSQKMERSLSASRERAPIYFMVFTNLIIIGIWGTLIYVVLQLFKIKKLSTHSNKK